MGLRSVVLGTALFALRRRTCVQRPDGRDRAGARPPALITPLASHVVLLGIARAGSRHVAVGERGIIVLSDDDGRSWRQAVVPVSVTLTAVTFPTAAQGWAVGHSGAILHSDDGGTHWTKQLDGFRAAQLALAAAAANMRKRPSKRARADFAAAQQLVSDGPTSRFSRSSSRTRGMDSCPAPMACCS